MSLLGGSDMFGWNIPHPLDSAICVGIEFFIGLMLSWQIDLQKDPEPAKEEPKAKEKPRKKDRKVDREVSFVGEPAQEVKSVTDSYSFASRTTLALIFMVVHMSLYAVFLLVGPDWLYKKDQFPIGRELNGDVEFWTVVVWVIAWSLLVMKMSWIDLHVDSIVSKLFLLIAVHTLGLLVFAELASNMPSF
jgi:hypothetical protein